MGGFRALSRAVIGAGARHFTGAAKGRAALVLGAQARPTGPLARAQRNLAAIARGTVLQPDQDFREGPQFVESGRFPPAQRLEPPGAEIIAASFHQCHLQLIADDLPNQWKILLQQLLLQIDRMRRHRHALAILRRPKRRRQQISERFAGAGARLNHDLLALIQGIGHFPRHVQLLFA